jgi:hypothetical protein
MHRPAAVIGALYLLSASATFASTTNNILVSGQPALAIIDGNGNGPDSEDCHFMATTDAMGNFNIMTTQDTHTPLRACAGQYSGDVDPSFPTDTSVFGTIQSSANIPGGIGFPHLPLSFDGMFLPQGGGAGGGGAAANGTRTISRVELTNGLGQVLGSGDICDSMARVTLANGLTMAVGLLMDTPGFLHIKNLPFEKADLSGFVFEDVYIPKTNGVVTVSLSSDPSTILIQLLLSGTCGRGAPTLSEWNLILLALALLAGGTWMLGRRQSFSEALPLP